MFVLKNNSGEYLYKAKGCEIITTKDIIKSIRFDTFEEASDFRRRASISNFSIKNIEDPVLLKNVGEANDSLKEMIDIKHHISSLSDRITGIIDEEERCNERLEEIKLEMVDITHSIEFYNMSASEGYKQAKRLQDRLRERRMLKDKLVEIKILKKYNANNTVIEKFDGVLERKYTPRRLPDLFK